MGVARFITYRETDQVPVTISLGDTHTKSAARAQKLKVTTTITAAQRQKTSSKKLDQNHGVFPSEVDLNAKRPQSGKGDTHQVRSRRTKVRGLTSTRGRKVYYI